MQIITVVDHGCMLATIFRDSVKSRQSDVHPEKAEVHNLRLNLSFVPRNLATLMNLEYVLQPDEDPSDWHGVSSVKHVLLALCMGLHARLGCESLIYEYWSDDTIRILHALTNVSLVLDPVDMLSVTYRQLGVRELIQTQD
jgi:hypothetical protein